MITMRKIYLGSSLALVMAANVQAETVFKAEDVHFSVQTIVTNLSHPWGMAFLPDGNILITERNGRLRLVENGKLNPEPVRGLPEIAVTGQGGLLDVALHPDFENNRWVYLSYAARGEDGYGTEVVRGRLEGMELKDVEKIFAAVPKSMEGGRHFGSRLLFAPDGKLFITLGDRGGQDRAQKLDDHAGSLIRLNDDGTVPEDNPFVKTGNAKPESYTLGNRNMQGIALQPGTNLVWTHEHGPQGGDEVNIMSPGTNYGWPVITYGVNYGIGTKIGEGTEKEGMAQPVHYWVPSIAPSGMVFYTGDDFPEWKGNLFVGSLKFGQLVRLVLRDNKVVKEERMIDGKLGRIRDVRQGPDGALYLLTDESNGALLRLRRID
jgi:glucose/arabinose dehydrogenase